MAITFGTAFNSASVAGTSSALSFGGTINAGANSCLIVCMMARDGGNPSAGTVKWNTTESFTFVVERTGEPSGLIAALWYLLNPTPTTANVDIVTSGQTWIGAAVISLFGIAQSSPIDDTDTTATNSSGSPSFSGLTTATDGCAVVDCLATNYSGTDVGMTSETNRVSRAQFIAANGAGRDCAASTIITKSPIGSVTMGWTDLSTLSSAYVGAAFKPAAAAANPVVPTRRIIYIPVQY